MTNVSTILYLKVLLLVQGGGDLLGDGLFRLFLSVQHCGHGKVVLGAGAQVVHCYLALLDIPGRDTRSSLIKVCLSILMSADISCSFFMAKSVGCMIVNSCCGVPQSVAFPK